MVPKASSTPFVISNSCVPGVHAKIYVTNAKEKYWKILLQNEINCSETEQPTLHSRVAYQQKSRHHLQHPKQFSSPVRFVHHEECQTTQQSTSAAAFGILSLCCTSCCYWLQIEIAFAASESVWDEANIQNPQI
jgi:hypothetical protein